MGELVVQGNADAQSGPPTGSEPRLRKRAARVIRRSVAIIIWLYVFVKLFIFDFDVYAINQFAPYLRWIIDYKFFLYIGLIGICAAFFRKWQVVFFIGYVIFYPIILLTMIVPYAVFRSRSWIFAFATINGIINFFTGFRRNMILFAVLCLSSLAISVSENRATLVISAASLFSFVLAVYVIRVFSVFRSDRTFTLYKRAFNAVNKHIMKTNKMDEAAHDLQIAELTETQLAHRNHNMGVAIVVNRASLFVASKLKAYQASKVSVIGDIFAIIGIVIIVTFAMAWINKALYKVDDTQFNFATSPSTFTFVYYSFNAFVFNSIPDLVPVKAIAQSLSMIEKLLALILGLILVSTLLSHKNQRQFDELSFAIQDIEAEGQDMEAFIQSEFHVKNIDDAISELERLKSGLLQIILWLSKGLT
jgi:hypothetical protein